jgi:hypothetical protein
MCAFILVMQRRDKLLGDEDEKNGQIVQRVDGEGDRGKNGCKRLACTF